MNARNKALLEWLKTASPQAIADTQTTAGYLRRIAYGQKIASAEMASGIERATSGLVTRKELRPHDWHLVWPELAERLPTMEQIVAQPSVRAQSFGGAVNSSSGMSQ